jgi:hypothetical protein
MPLESKDQKSEVIELKSKVSAGLANAGNSEAPNQKVEEQPDEVM